MRELPFNVNVTLEQEKIEVEKMRDALIGSLTAMTQAIPQMATQGQDPTAIISKISEVIQMRQKGKAIEDAIQEVFKPETPPAGAEAPVEQPVPAAPGQPPAGGALPPQQGRPDLQTMLSSLSGEGRTGAAVRTTRERAI